MNVISKTVVVSLASFGLSVSAIAEVTQPISTPQAEAVVFNNNATDADLSYAFGGSQDLQVQAMTNQQMEETQGAALPLAMLGGAAIGMWTEHGLSYYKTGHFASTNDVLKAGVIGATPAGAFKVGKFAKYGREVSFGKNFRIAPFGNRTGHPQGRYPHYHRRGLDKNGNTIPGQGIGRHRPWEKKSTDNSWRDRW